MAGMNTKLVENFGIIWGVAPANYSGAAGTAQFMSLKNFNHISFVIMTGAWAGGTAAVTLNQATAVANTGQKALAFSNYYLANSTNSVFVNTAVVSNTFNLNAANTIAVIEVDANQLDVANNYDCISIEIASPSSNADFYSVLYIAGGSRYPQLAVPNALVD